MNDQFDHLIGQLAASPTDRSLEHLEPQVIRGVAERRVWVRTATALAPVRAASIGLSLAVGIAAGGLTAAASAGSHGGAFAPTDLAPSTLLERGR